MDPTRLVVPNDHCGQVDLTGVRVLVVDDDADARRLTKRLLVECKADVLHAGLGAGSAGLRRLVQTHGSGL